MFKLLMFFVIVFFVGVFLIAVSKLVQVSLKDNKPNVNEDLEEYINILKQRVNDFEMQSKAGMENAEAKLEYYKEQLKKAESYITKTKNL